MKRFHVNVSVADLNSSIQFYETLFGTAPLVTKSDYAKWMLEDPRINFSIVESRTDRGINHVGFQVESEDELSEIQTRLDAAEQMTFEQPDTECCYARSSKTWASDPDGVAWETFLTHGQITHYGDGSPEGKIPAIESSTSERCCA